MWSKWASWVTLPVLCANAKKSSSCLLQKRGNNLQTVWQAANSTKLHTVWQAAKLLLLFFYPQTVSFQVAHLLSPLVPLQGDVAGSEGKEKKGLLYVVWTRLKNPAAKLQRPS